MVFDEYSEYYDLLYQDKDYEAECAYLGSILDEHYPTAIKILEFGSGSGIHGRIFAEMGYLVSGIERSKKMIQLGELSPTRSYNDKSYGSFSCTQGDCLNEFLGNDFDVSIALFHVLSYQTRDEQVLAMLSNAHRQLISGGLFILDYWYSPAVWSIGPSLRVKKVQNRNLSIIRIAEPESHTAKNLVKVHYQTFVENLRKKEISKIEETHEMRAFDLNEIEFFSKQTGFSLIHSEEWMSGNKPSNETWGVCSVLKKV